MGYGLKLWCIFLCDWELGCVVVVDVDDWCFIDVCVVVVYFFGVEWYCDVVLCVDCDDFVVVCEMWQFVYYDVVCGVGE